jgi:hypothetical protein
MSCGPQLSNFGTSRITREENRIRFLKNHTQRPVAQSFVISRRGSAAARLLICTVYAVVRPDIPSYPRAITTNPSSIALDNAQNLTSGRFFGRDSTFRFESLNSVEMFRCSDTFKDCMGRGGRGREGCGACSVIEMQCYTSS